MTEPEMSGEANEPEADELAARIIEIYERNADRWDRDRDHPGELMERDWLGLFLEGMPERPRILDLGCGSGVPLARYLIGKGCAVTGVDSSPSMIDKCRERFPEETWLVADMRELALGERFDGILAWDSFFHLRVEDQEQMFPLFGRHAAAGCALLFTSGPSRGEALGSLGDDTLYHASLDPAEYRTLLTENGFSEVEHRVEDPDCAGHTIWLAKRTG